MKEMSRGMRGERFLSVFLCVGIAVALAIPSPQTVRRLSAQQSSLFIVMEGNYLNPLFSSARTVHLLNGAAKQFASFAGYDEFCTRVDLPKNSHIAKITRYGGDLLSLLEIGFALKEDIGRTEEPVYISEDFWESALGRASNVIGSILRVHNSSYRIAGVTKSRVGLLSGTDIWIPVRSRGQFGSMSSMRIVGALKPGNNWRIAQKILSRVFSSAIPDQTFSEVAGATMVPLDTGVRFGDKTPTIAQEAGERFVWTGS